MVLNTCTFLLTRHRTTRTDLGHLAAQAVSRTSGCGREGPPCRRRVAGSRRHSQPAPAVGDRHACSEDLIPHARRPSCCERERRGESRGRSAKGRWHAPASGGTSSRATSRAAATLPGVLMGESILDQIRGMSPYCGREFRRAKAALFGCIACALPADRSCR